MVAAALGLMMVWKWGLEIIARNKYDGYRISLHHLSSAYHHEVKDTQSLGDILTQRLVTKALALSIES